jgi:hypothetical protein
MIKIGYFNIRGLTQPKLYACVSLIDSGLFDILILAEHWFPITFPYMQHPYCFIESKYIRPENPTGRATGGVLVLVNPLFQSFITQRQIFFNAVCLSFDSFTLAGVYLPPSLSIPELARFVDTLPYHDVLVGDINCRFEGLAADRFSETDVQEFWQHYVLVQSKQLLSLDQEPLPVTDAFITALNSSRSDFLKQSLINFKSPRVDSLLAYSTLELDHVFANQNFIDVTTLRLIDARPLLFPSDHEYLIHLTVDTEDVIPSNEDIQQVCGRFYLEHLDNPLVSLQLNQHWAIIAEELESLWKEQLSVDEMDSTIVAAIQTVAENVLGSYTVNQKRKAPDKRTISLNGTLSQVAAIQLFKRHQRSEAMRTRIVPRRPGGNVFEECLDKLHSQFNVTSSISDCRPTNGPPLEWTSELLEMVNVQKIEKFIHDYPIHKACGNDGLHTLLLRHLLDTSFISFLHRLFVKCIESGCTPSRWNESIVHLIPKGIPKDENGKRISPTADTVRPLSILPMFRRIFESLLIPAFTDDTKQFCRLHPSQAGFRSGYSTLSNIAVCHHAIRHKLSRVSIFLDFKAAYDTIKPERVISILQSRKMPLLLQKLVYSSMFVSGSYTAVINGIQSSPQVRNCGLPQGSPLSPIIFNLFIDSLVRYLNSISNDMGVPHCLFYADDGVILSPDIHTAKRLLRMAEKWSKDNGMVFNVSKCGILSAIIAKDPIYLQGQVVPIVDTYMYLGLPFTVFGIDTKTHINELSRTIQGFLKQIRFSSNGWSSYTRWIIYSTFLRPKLEYAAPIFQSFAFARKSGALYRPLEEAQRLSLSWILRCKMTTPNIDGAILGCLPIEQRFSQLRTMFQLHRLTIQSESPLEILLRSSANLSSDTMIRHLDSDILYNEFVVLYPTVPVRQQKPLLHKFLLMKRKEFFDRRAAITLKYIDPNSRSNSLVDCTLFAAVKYQSDFIRWRRGKWLMGNKCICGGMWNRIHAGHLGDIQKHLGMDLYREYLDTRTRNVDGYTVIDFLLNRRQFDLAFHILQDWKKQIFTATAITEQQ